MATRGRHERLSPRAQHARIASAALPVPRQGATGYVEYYFLAGAGSLAAGRGSGPITSSLHQTSWANVDETNDYSYALSATYLPTSRVTLYRNGVLVAGIEPTAAAGAAKGAAAANALLAASPAGLAPAQRLQASPNPATARIWLDFALDRPEAYTLAVYDAQGRLVQLLPGGRADAGERRQVQWDASSYAAGLYLVRLTAASGVQQLRLMKE